MSHHCSTQTSFSSAFFHLSSCVTCHGGSYEARRLGNKEERRPGSQTGECTERKRKEQATRSGTEESQVIGSVI